MQRPASGTVDDAELQRAGSHRRGRRDWSRLPLAAVNYFRVVAFRQTVDIGDFISVTYAEAFITIGYIIAIFTWEFINSESLSSHYKVKQRIDSRPNSHKHGWVHA